MKNGKIELFTDLVVWQERHKLVLMVYSTTKLFPKEEMFGLVDQMRRAASSVTANVAEGFGRQTYKEKIQFYYMAKGSVSELRNFFFIAKDVGYLSASDFDSLLVKSVEVEQLLNGLISKSKSFINQKSINH